MFEGLLAKLIAAAAVAVGIALAAHFVDAKFYNGKIAEQKAEYDDRILQAQKDKDAAEENYRQQLKTAQEEGNAKQAKIDELTKTATDAQGKLAAAQVRIAGLAANNGKLRNDLATYARGGSDDTAAACEARAGSLAGLLAEGDEVVAGLSAAIAEGGRLAAESARAASTYANQVNICVRAWPR